jgi:hypothetical protein
VAIDPVGSSSDIDDFANELSISSARPPKTMSKLGRTSRTI